MSTKTNKKACRQNKLAKKKTVIFVEFGGKVVQQIVDIPMGTNCAYLADLYLFSYESEFLQKLVKNKKIKEARLFNFTFRYIDDVLSINNPNFLDLILLIYPSELENKESTDTASSASFLDLYLKFNTQSSQYINQFL